MSFQMAAIMGLGLWGGMKLDAMLGWEKKPFCTVILALIGAVGGIYLFIKDFLKKK